MIRIVLTVVALAFALVTGANEGGAILTMGLHLRPLRPIGALMALTIGVVAVPAVLGTAVAHTLASRLVDAGAPDGRIAFGIGLCGALLVVAVLTTLRLPTSLSLALVGGITGAGLGFGLPVSWTGVGDILLFGVIAPVAGTFAGAAFAGALRRLGRGPYLPAAVRWATCAAYLGQVIAYGANGGQKMIAVFAVCGAAGPTLGIRTMLVIGGCFGAGSIVSARRLAGAFGNDLLPVRPVHELSAGLASTAAVLTSVAAGMPVSMTQVVAAAYVGAGVSESRRRVRWTGVARLGRAWCLTLPASVALALAGAASVRGLR
ncbi:anion permease [Kribbella sp. WER1]